jgi:4-amino-4-deoxy-L-arabinose transferase-like glycosyltransferase
MKRSRSVLAALLLAAATLVVYARRLDVSPPALHPDEIALARQADSIARTGHDLDNRRLPLYFHLHDNVWAQPVAVYVTALFLKTIGLNESSVRLTSVVVAAIDVALIYIVAARLFGSEGLALIAGALLLLTPSHFIHGRLAVASIYPVALILVWLLCLMLFVERRQPALLCASTLALGVGFYSHPTAVLMMPAYLVLTALVVLAIRGSTSLYVVSLAGFLAPLLIAIPWLYLHREVFPFTLGDWGLQPLANPRDGLRYSLFSWPALAARSTVYWGFFSPSYLFFSGGADLVGSTRQAGVFLGLTSIPLLYGVFQIVRSRWSDPRWRLIVLGFAASPFAAATFTDPKAAGRAVAMLPFGILIAIAGVDTLLNNRQRALRLAAVAVLLLLPMQFYGFYADYFTRYPQRASAAFAPGVAPE